MNKSRNRMQQKLIINHNSKSICMINPIFNIFFVLVAIISVRSSGETISTGMMFSRNVCQLEVKQ